MGDNVKNEILKWTKSQRQFKRIPRDISGLYLKKKQQSIKGVKQLRICIFCNPCGGNGDIMFATKLFGYLKKWYGCSVTIVTTRPSTFISSKIIPKRNVYCVKHPSFKPEDCLTSEGLKVYDINCKRQQNLKPFDLFFVAPWVSGELFTYTSLQKVFANSNPFNTYIFSAYNQDYGDQPFDFVTGIGKKRLGLMLTDLQPVKPTRLLKKIGEPYVFSYISQSNVISKKQPIECIKTFIENIIKKYPDGICIIVPPFIQDHLIVFKQILKKFKNKLVIDFITNDGSLLPFGPDNDDDDDELPLFTIRSDILPVTIKEFRGLLKYSLPEILLTGNQSVTDLLSINKKQTILYYQLMPWETDFAKELKLLTHIPWLPTKKSCGNQTKAKPQYNKVNKHDFRILARPKMDSVIQFGVHLKKSKWLQEYTQLYSESHTKKTFMQKLSDL